MAVKCPGLPVFGSFLCLMSTDSLLVSYAHYGRMACTSAETLKSTTSTVQTLLSSHSHRAPEHSSWKEDIPPGNLPPVLQGYPGFQNALPCHLVLDRLSSNVSNVPVSQSDLGLAFRPLHHCGYFFSLPRTLVPLTQLTSLHSLSNTVCSTAWQAPGALAGYTPPLGLRALGRPSL